MTSSRDSILNKLRAAHPKTHGPFPDVPARPAQYWPVTSIQDTSPAGLLARFTEELTRLQGEVFVVDGDDAARAKVLDLLKSHQATHILAWDFRHIPVSGLQEAIKAAGIRITQPETHDEFRQETIDLIEAAQVGLSGADAAAATTGTLIVSTGPGKGRIPTVLPPVHLAVVTLDQILPRVEDWLAAQRANGMAVTRDAANICFISGPSRTGDIEMVLVLGVHGPGRVQVVVKR